MSRNIKLNLASFTNQISEFSTFQLAIIAGSILILFYISTQELLDCIYSPLLRHKTKDVLGASFLFTFIGAFLPGLSACWLYPQVNEHRRDFEKRWPSYIAIATQLCGYVGILIAVLLMIGFLLLAEVFLMYPFSVVPPTTAVWGCVMVWAGNRVLPPMKITQKVTVVSLLLCFTLSVKYIDWNSRKAFIRDLYHVRTGMSVAEVKAVMAGYIQGTGEEDDEESDEEVEALGYRHSWKPEYNSDIGMIYFVKGRVQSVEFLPD